MSPERRGEERERGVTAGRRMRSPRDLFPFLPSPRARTLLLRSIVPIEGVAAREDVAPALHFRSSTLTVRIPSPSPP